MIDRVHIVSNVTAALKVLYPSNRFSRIDVHWLSDDELLEVNRTHLDHDYYTDIITFDNNVGRTVHGEIYISTDRVIENSQEYGVSVLNELARVVVHGVLHLCGYKDKSEEDVLKMRGREDYWIEKLNLLNNN